MTLLLRNSSGREQKLRPTQFEQGRSITVPAPYGGINLRDDITALKPNEARILNNWLPGAGNLAIRPGFTDHGTGMGSGEVKTLAAFRGLTSSKMIAGANGKLWDVTSAGAATQLATGFTEDRWQWETYNNRLILVNGTDAPTDYNGTATASTAWSGSGLTIANLVNVALVRNRLWFCENNSADVWYAGIGSITGSLTKFQLSQIASGGTCMAIGSWSRDAGDGADDFTVFVMSTGEIIVYQGDPASTFSLQGKFAGASPIGRKCLFKVGGELVVITRMGFLPVSAAVAGVALDLARIDPWGKIAPLVSYDANLFAGNAGWQGVLHEGLVYVNVPQTTGQLSKQYFLNTRTGSWATISDWNPSSMLSFNNRLYIGLQTGGAVSVVGGSTDDGTDITATANGAFVYPSQAQQAHVFTAVRPKVQVTGELSGYVGVDVDFVSSIFDGGSIPIVSATGDTPWDTSAWDTSAWASENPTEQLWFTITGSGRSVATKFRVTGSTQDARWFATDIMMKTGGTR